MPRTPRRLLDIWDYALLRLRPATPAPRPAPHHAVHLYSDDSTLLDRMEAWVAEGHAAGQRTVVFAVPERREALVQRLRPLGLVDHVDLHDAEAALERFVVDGVPEPDLFQRVVGDAVRAYQPGRVRAYGEMVSVLWKQGNVRGAMDLEALWDVLQGQVDCPLLCAYDEADVGEHRDEVCGAHTHTV